MHSLKIFIFQILYSSKSIRAKLVRFQSCQKKTKNEDLLNSNERLGSLRVVYFETINANDYIPNPR